MKVYSISTNMIKMILSSKITIAIKPNTRFLCYIGADNTGGSGGSYSKFKKSMSPVPLKNTRFIATATNDYTSYVKELCKAAFTPISKVEVDTKSDSTGIRPIKLYLAILKTAIMIFTGLAYFKLNEKSDQKLIKLSGLNVLYAQLREDYGDLKSSVTSSFAALEAGVVKNHEELKNDIAEINNNVAEIKINFSKILDKISK